MSNKVKENKIPKKIEKDCWNCKYGIQYGSDGVDNIYIICNNELSKFNIPMYVILLGKEALDCEEFNIRELVQETKK